jgi:23S rRNA (guanosine2251-2'-O)-methyltransferase
MPDPFFIARQCSNPHCRFRFPAHTSQSIKAFCPKCGFKLEVVGEPYTNFRPDNNNDPKGRIDLSILLDNVRSALNVGSILRTCDGIGVTHVYLCGITSTPENPKLRKTALSAEMNPNWSYHLNALDAVAQLKERGYEVWSLELAECSTPIQDALRSLPNKPILLVTGNELAGVDPAILAVSDRLIHLPMQGQKHSYNIAVAVGMAASLLFASGCV